MENNVSTARNGRCHPHGTLQQGHGQQFDSSKYQPLPSGICQNPMSASEQTTWQAMLSRMTTINSKPLLSVVTDLCPTHMHFLSTSLMLLAISMLDSSVRSSSLRLRKKFGLQGCFSLLIRVDKSWIFDPQATEFTRMSLSQVLLLLRSYKIDFFQASTVSKTLSFLEHY